MKADYPAATALFPVQAAPRFEPSATWPATPASAFAAGPAGTPSTPTPREFLLMLWRHRWLIGACVVLVSLFAFALLRLQKPVYTSTAKVWVQTEQQGTPSFLSGIAAYRESQYAESVTHRIETEMELLLTRSSADNVVSRLGLTREQFARSPIVAATQAARDAVRRVTGIAAKPVDPLLAPSLGELFLETVTVQPLRSKTAETASNVLEIKLESGDPKLAPRALAALLDNYLGVGAKQTQKLGQATSQLLQTRLGEARDELRRLDDELVALALRSSGRAETAAVTLPSAPFVVGGVPATTGGVGTNGGVGAGISGGGGVVGNAPGAPGGLRLDLALDASRGGNAQAVTTLKTQTLELQARLDELRQVYTDDADNVRALRRRIDASRQRLATSVRAGVLAEAEFGRLERQRTLAQDRFVELRKKLDQIELFLELNPTAVDSRVVVDPPSPGKLLPSKSKLLLAGLGPVAGLLLGLLLAGLRELFDGRLRNPAEVERLLGLPALAALPSLTRRQRERLLAGGSAGSASEPLLDRR